MQHSARYTFGFAIAVSFVASVVVAGTSVSLRTRQNLNRVLDRQRNVLDVAGLVERGERLSAAEVATTYRESIRSYVIELQSGKTVTDIDVASFDQREQTREPATSRIAPPNLAGVQRLPLRALVQHVVIGDSIVALVLPIEGQGLWSTIYGYIALSPDLEYVRGITFYEHGETPGLGGEIDAGWWRAKWQGRQVFDDAWHPRLEVIKGVAPPPDVAPFEVDGLSGATLTGRAITHIVQYWLGEAGFGPYLARYRREAGIQ